MNDQENKNLASGCMNEELGSLVEVTPAELAQKVGGTNWNHQYQQGINELNNYGNMAKAIASAGTFAGPYRNDIYTAIYEAEHGPVHSDIGSAIEGIPQDSSATDFQTAADGFSRMANCWTYGGDHSLTWDLIGQAYECEGLALAKEGHFNQAATEFENAVSNFGHLINTVHDTSAPAWQNIAHAYSLEGDAEAALGHHNQAGRDFDNAATNLAAEVNISGNHSAAVFNSLGEAYENAGVNYLNAGNDDKAGNDYANAAANYGDAGNATAEQRCQNEADILDQ